MEETNEIVLGDTGDKGSRSHELNGENGKCVGLTNRVQGMRTIQTGRGGTRGQTWGN